MTDQNKFYHLYESENARAIADLVPQLQQSGNINELEDLKDVIYDLLALWETDYTYKKAAVDDDYLNLVLLLEKISGQKQNLEMGKYYKFRAIEAFRNDAPELGQSMARLSEKLFLQTKVEQPRIYAAYHLLSDLYVVLWKQQTDDNDDFFCKAIDILCEGAEKADPKNNFYDDYFLLLMQGYNCAKNHQLLLIIDEAFEKFMQTCKEMASKLPSHSISMANNFSNTFFNKPVDPKFETYFIYFLEKGIDKNYRKKIDVTSTGHLYMREGKRFGRIDFLQHALKLYKQSLKSKSYHALMHHYIAETLENMAVIHYNANDLKAYNALRQQIMSIYFDNFDENAENFSFCAHATDYMMNRFFQISGSKEQRAWLKKIKPYLLVTEKTGNGFYFSPYKNLIIASYLENDLSASKIWAKKAYLLFNILVKNQFESILQFFQTENCLEMELYISQIIEKIEQQDEGFYTRKLDYEDLIMITSEDL